MIENDIDLRPSEGEDEAQFARGYYKDSWIFDQYQDDRINLFRENVFPLTLPEGFVVMFGTHNCKVFDTWCQHWSYERCVGFELYNEVNHPRVTVMDVRGLGDWATCPIALCWNDIGSWKRTPDARTASYNWARKNIVQGGFYIERSDEIATWPLSEDMTADGSFEIFDTLLDGSYVIYRRL